MKLDLDWKMVRSELWPEIQYEIRPLRVWAFQELVSCWETRENRKDLSPTIGAELMATLKKIFPEHLRNISGLTLVQDGKSREATPESICEETALMPLAGEIFSRLIALSEVGQSTGKK